MKNGIEKTNAVRILEQKKIDFKVHDYTDSGAVSGEELVAALGEDWFTVCIIPTTWRETNLSQCGKGGVLNLETDMLGKYVLNMLRRMNGRRESNVSMNTLYEAGFLE